MKTDKKVTKDKKELDENGLSDDQIQQLMGQYFNGGLSGKRGITKPRFNKAKRKKINNLQKVARRVNRNK